MNFALNPNQMHLGIAEIIVTDSPMVISTVLGSCISVCVYSVKGTAGGINHFALPSNPDITALNQEPYRYGDKSMRAMLKAILALPGVQARDLRAKVVGGACLMGEGVFNAAIGKQNAQIAQEILSEFRIAVTDVVVGGANGRKVLFHTNSGEVKITSVNNSNTNANTQANANANTNPNAAPSQTMLMAQKSYAIATKNVPQLQGLVAIGASMGGTDAVKDLLVRLPANIPPILIVQHIPAMFSKAYANRLNELCPFLVKEAEQGEVVQEGRVLIAPGDRHMKLESFGFGYQIKLSDSLPVNRHKPSVDVLFDSVAQVTKGRAVGVILTGMGGDGAKGLLTMKKAGCPTIAQDEKSCVVFGMPKVAIDLGGVDQVADINDIPRRIMDTLKALKSA